MGRRNKNTFSKALGHLKSRKIDEKIQMLSERPANSTLGYMTAVGSQSNPNFVSTQRGQESALNVVRPDFSIGENPENSTESQDTTGLFQEDGTLRVASPPGDNSYILGPMAAMWYAWANSTRIGYIRQSDRRMVNLGGLTGKLSDWDGQQHPSGSGPFYSYGQMTLEQAQWFRTIQKQPGATNDPDTYNYRAFYPGPPSNTPDAFGRYYCVVTGEPLQGEELPGTGENEVNPGEGGPQDPDSIFSAIMDRLRAGMGLSKAEREFLRKRLPPRTSIIGNRIEKEAFAMPPDKFRERYGLNPEDVIDFYRNHQGSQSQSQSEPETPQNQTWENIKDTTSKVADILWKGAKLLSGLGKGKKLLADFIADYTINPLVDRAFGFSVADSAGEYNQKLLTSLGTTVFTGKNQEIKLSDKAKKDLINSIDLDMLDKHMTVGPTPNIDADNAVNPGKGKQNGLLKGSWGNQGGTHINYDPSNGKFTVTMVKMLRDFGDLDERNADGKITNFEDIPNPSVDDIKKIFKEKGLEGPMKKFYSTLSNLGVGSFKPISAGFDPDEAAQMMYDHVPNVTKALYNVMIEGSASNIVHFRNQALKLGLPKSEIEKMGAGFGGYVYSQVEYLGNDIPGKHGTKSVGGIVNKKAIKYLGILESKRIPLSESRKADIIKNLKKPVVLPETKQKSYKVKPKYKTLNTVISKPVATPEEYKPPMKMWGRYEYNKNVRDSQEKLNHVMDLLGEGEQAMEYRLKNGTTKSQKQMEKFYGEHPYLYDFYFNNMNHKMLRKEQVEGGEFVVFLVAENGKKVSMSQSKLNEKLAEAEDQKLLDEYNKSNPKSEPISYEQDPLFKKVSKRLKSVTNYSKKPSPKGYPDKAPPKMVNGFHPDLGKRYKYDKLDPQSAEFMPNQGNPEIDANIEKFTDKNAKIRKIKNLLGKKG